MSKRVIFLTWTLLFSGMSSQAQVKRPLGQPTPTGIQSMMPPGAQPAAQPGAPSSPDAVAPDQGFVSKKTHKSMSKSDIEEITNDNFPDLIESFDYPNADIADLVKAISELTGKNFIVDTNVHGKITIIAPSRITVAEAYKAFLSALAINGLAVVPGDGFYKIKQARAAQRDNIETYGGAYYPSSDQMITRIIKLKYISADEINKQVRTLTSNQGEIMAYVPTNSLIISDYGANVDRVMKILGQLDVQGYEEQMEVIRIHYAHAKDMAELIDKIINKGDNNQNSRFGVPAFRRPGESAGGSSSGAEVYSVVVPDDRTNSIIVVGNKAGIDKIKHLVERLDFRLRPDESGGVFVYYLHNHDAEQLATTLNNIATEAKKALDQQNKGSGAGMPGAAPGAAVGPSSTAIFGGDVKIAADKETNSLIITANKQDYEVVKGILARIDIPRDQVYIKAYILEMNVTHSNDWAIDYYKFAGNTAARMGFRSDGNFQQLIDPTQDAAGGIFGFGGGGTVNLNTYNSSTTGGTTGATTATGTTIPVQSIDGLIKLLETNLQTNIISTPQVMAINNEEAVIEVGDKVPVATTTTQGVAGTPPTTSVQRESVSTKLTLTAYLSPENDRVRMKINQEVANINNQITKGLTGNLSGNSIATSTRNIKTTLVVDNGDTAVLGGLMKDEDDLNVSQIPVLGDIPIIGWLFKAKNSSRQKTNLVVFITPKIVRTGEDNASIVNQKIDERIDFVQHSMDGRDPHGSYIDSMPRRTVKVQPTSENAPTEESKPSDQQLNNVEPAKPTDQPQAQPPPTNNPNPDSNAEEPIETF